jgi:uncharacterized surface protein with fasciclin (FAS1) repeats
MRMAAVRLFILLLLTLGTLAHAVPHKSARSKISDLADTVNKTVILNKFATLVQASDLGTFLSSRGPFTMFAPTNSAFSKLPPGMFEDLLQPANKVQLQRIILFSVVSGKAWDAKDLKTLKSLPSCEGNPLPLRISRGALLIGKAKLLRADIHCANGLMHQVDSLLMPPKLLLVAAVAAPDATASTNTAPVTPAADGAASTNTATATPAAPDPSPATNGATAAASATNAAPSMR